MTDDADADEVVDPDGESETGEKAPAADADADADTEPVDGEDEAEADLNNGYDDTVPNVELGLYQLSVRVSGRSDDDLKTVEDSAKRLMDYLIDRAAELEERPDDRGLS
ncbi:hypothetical protein SAMN04487947_3806 [Halogeometricum rufum]|uniref:Uncharacterized protein n=1 Tax=Halogeometricum rufum TaxID=553469 RepID=A0A1I6IWR4_9EURY|nr:hypothetical protein [Halogeometricum rufum]SFR71186.1 hypothetical protein SAMN04487947_3806 [Halogeometricum rufum]